MRWKKSSTFVFKWQIYLAWGLWDGKRCSRMTNIFGIRLTRNRNGKFQMACILDIRLYNHDFKVSKIDFLSSIFGIAKTSPGAGFKKIFKIFLSPKYDNYIWHAAYEIERVLYFVFKWQICLACGLWIWKKDVQLLVFKWQIYLARGLWNGKIRSQMTNIFGIRLSRNKNGKFSNDIYLWHAALQSNFHVIKKRFSVQYIWHWALRLTIFFPFGTERVKELTIRKSALKVQSQNFIENVCSIIWFTFFKLWKFLCLNFLFTHSLKLLWFVAF